MTKVLLALIWLANAVSAQYVGAQVCGSCHAGRLKQQSASEHARALRPAGEHALAGFFAEAAPNPGYQLARTPAGFEARIADGKGEKTIPIEWAFGAGDQAVTFVSQLDEDSYLEHRFSFYARARNLNLTPGHPARARAGYPESAGVVYPTFDPEARILRCFQCHSTGRLTLGEHMRLVPAESGVRCEACHGPGKAHVDAIRAGNLAAARKAIQNPGRMSATAQLQVCGDCHRKPQQGATATDWSDPWNTRHQPLYLAQSACFRQGNGKLTCLTCHDPHDALRRNDAAFYNGRCVRCHAGGPHPSMAGAGNCIRCHMPEVSPREDLAFANHWIGVYREGSPLKPIARQ